MRKENVVDGVQNAPHRSLFHALGLTVEEQKRPLIGIVSSYNEMRLPSVPEKFSFSARKR